MEYLTSAHPNFKDRYYDLLGCSCYFEKKYSEAHTWFNKAILENPDNLDYFISKVACQIQLD